jgi:DNA-binding GntR family transcriptional regulator
MGKTATKNHNSRVFEKLKHEILNLELVPGQMLSENEICERFSISRTPVRDALRSLQEQGYVITIPYHGIYVTKLNYSTIKQMIYMRIAVETKVICDFMELVTPVILEEIRYIIRKQEAILLEKDFNAEQFYRLDAQMHAIWFDRMDKRKIWELVQEAQLHYTRYRKLDFDTETNYSRIIKEHRELFDCIERKDKKELESVLQAHLSYCFKRMKHVVEVSYKDYFEDEVENRTRELTETLF